MKTPMPSLAYRRWVFLAFLVSLHLVFLQGPATPLGRLLFLSHIGIGLLWQPFIHQHRRLGFAGTALVVCCSTVLAFFLNWGLLVGWTMLLTGVVGGKVFLFPNRWERFFHLLALGYLVTAVLALALPHSLVALRLAEPVLGEGVLYLMPAVFVLMAVLPVEQGAEGERAEIVDYVYGVLVFLLLAVIVFGSLSSALLLKASYFESLMMTLALMAGILLLLGFIWNPRAGFGGLGSAVAQHVISLGLPIESWLEKLAQLSRDEEAPERFLELACADMPARLPGVLGGRADAPVGHVEFGVQEGQRVEFAHGHLKLVLWCHMQPSPSLHWHYDLAARLLAEFYMGKWRAQELKRYSFVEAVHETGARLTHDVKNLLQSLETLCAAAGPAGAPQSPRFNDLLRRQLPEITARLRQTLTKLAAPAVSAHDEPMAATDWLAALEYRYAADWIVFAAPGEAACCRVNDPALFSSVAENLLQNVIDKRRAGAAGVRAEVVLHCDPGGAWLEIADDGAAIPEPAARDITHRRVASENGLGIGLYQSARLAEEGGYRLTLVENRAGRVCFRLAPAAQETA
ncbi:MAG: ATP-binding protein [Pseudomonadota bacterium]